MKLPTLGPARRRMLIGAVTGVVVVGVHIASAIVNLFVHPEIQHRATPEAVGLAFAYVSLFAIGGAATARMTLLRSRWPAYLLGGAIAGALVWSYLTVTWAFTARAAAVGPPTISPLESVAIGAGLGLAAGGLLLVITSLRKRPQ